MRGVGAIEPAAEEGLLTKVGVSTGDRKSLNAEFGNTNLLLMNNKPRGSVLTSHGLTQ